LLGDTVCKCIVVLPAYRLNIFGFLASKEPLGEDAGRGAGNYGFWDQRAALEWVRDNIGYFGQPGPHHSRRPLCRRIFGIPEEGERG